jgi:trimethylamine---corrinoid protein Co-methyltransferase
MVEREAEVRRPRRRSGGITAAEPRAVNYSHLRNPFEPQRIFSDDRIEEIHETALRVLEDLGMRILLPEARTLFASAGAIVDEETKMVRIGREIVDAALATAPASMRLHAPNRAKEQHFEFGMLSFQAGAGCPHATDLARGRRPGTLADFEETVKLVQGFDVLHLVGPTVEAQDVTPALRHMAVTRALLILTDKPPFIYSRGRSQVEDCMAMIRIAHGIDEARFDTEPWCYTVINTNSPRTLDIPMAQGLIDFARAGQISIVTPFCLAGAMAPITIAGALTLQHAEALAAIALTQIARPGAPVMNGGFSSNVDMKSGSPAFGTPEHVKTVLGAGQLARRIGLPWRAGAGSASKVADAQGTTETLMSVWGAVLAGASHIIHAAGWVDGGLGFSYEKLITDLEGLQTIAELCTATPGTTDDIGYDAIAEVEPGGHFFSAAHTMTRYHDAFYAPLVADWSNFGQWQESGGLSAAERATKIWQKRLRDYVAPPMDEARIEALDAFIARRTESGGAPPLD